VARGGKVPMKEEERKKVIEFLLGLESTIRLLREIIEEIEEGEVRKQAAKTKKGIREDKFDENLLKKEWEKLRSEFKGNKKIVDEFIKRHTTRNLENFARVNRIPINTKQAKSKIAQELRGRLRELEGIQESIRPLHMS